MLYLYVIRPTTTIVSRVIFIYLYNLSYLKINFHVPFHNEEDAHLMRGQKTAQSVDKWAEELDHLKVAKQAQIYGTTQFGGNEILSLIFQQFL